MIHIIHDGGEFNVTNLELFIYLKNITDLKWFAKKVVKIANNKDEVKAAIEFQTRELMEKYETEFDGRIYPNKTERIRFIKKCKRLLEELEKI
jgi:hypothetical protein